MIGPMPDPTNPGEPEDSQPGAPPDSRTTPSAATQRQAQTSGSPDNQAVVPMAAADAQTTPGTESPPPTAPTPEPATTRPSTTRAADAWFATGAVLVILVLLLILILQNQETVEVSYLWFSGSLPLGSALLIAALAGGSVVMIIGIVRLTQLRISTKRAQKAAAAAKQG